MKTLAVKIITLLTLVFCSVKAQVPLTNPPPYVIPIASPYIAAWTMQSTDAPSALSFIGGVNGGGASGIAVANIQHYLNTAQPGDGGGLTNVSDTTKVLTNNGTAFNPILVNPTIVPSSSGENYAVITNSVSKTSVNFKTNGSSQFYSIEQTSVNLGTNVPTLDLTNISLRLRVGGGGANALDISDDEGNFFFVGDHYSGASNLPFGGINYNWAIWDGLDSFAPVVWSQDNFFILSGGANASSPVISMYAGAITNFNSISAKKFYGGGLLTTNASTLTSAQLNLMLTDETGSGGQVASNAPTISSPNLVNGTNNNFPIGTNLLQSQLNTIALAVTNIPVSMTAFVDNLATGNGIINDESRKFSTIDSADAALTSVGITNGLIKIGYGNYNVTNLVFNNVVGMGSQATHIFGFNTGGGLGANAQFQISPYAPSFHSGFSLDCLAYVNNTTNYWSGIGGVNLNTTNFIDDVTFGQTSTNLPVDFYYTIGNGTSQKTYVTRSKWTGSWDNIFQSAGYFDYRFGDLTCLGNSSIATNSAGMAIGNGANINGNAIAYFQNVNFNVGGNTNCIGINAPGANLITVVNCTFTNTSNGTQNPTNIFVAGNSSVLSIRGSIDNQPRNAIVFCTKPIHYVAPISLTTTNLNNPMPAGAFLQSDGTNVSFSFNGSGLTNLQSANLVGVIPTANSLTRYVTTNLTAATSVTFQFVPSYQDTNFGVQQDISSGLPATFVITGKTTNTVSATMGIFTGTEGIMTIHQ